MTDAKHTPGPWQARGGGYTFGTPGHGEDRSQMMDWCSGVDCRAPFTENEHGNYERVEEQAVAKAHGRTLQEAQANALLIAAAPELLALLQECRDFFANCPAYDGANTDNLDTRCMDAIARATRSAS